MQPLVSSLSAGDRPVHRLRENCSSLLTGAQNSHLQRVTVPEAAYIYNYDVDLLKMSRVMLETCNGKEIPLQAWAGPEGSRRVRLLDFKTIGT
jgi:hypothetical protein